MKSGLDAAEEKTIRSDLPSILPGTWVGKVYEGGASKDVSLTLENGGVYSCTGSSTFGNQISTTNDICIHAQSWELIGSSSVKLNYTSPSPYCEAGNNCLILLTIIHYTENIIEAVKMGSDDNNDLYVLTKS